ncbi:MAG: hypothetical protein K0S00_3083 [Xanthobacteraceae bacterium]|jgi:hypothetical protein|nr:hypothetical protein [Xanthobacteraceae bacterium]
MKKIALVATIVASVIAVPAATFAQAVVTVPSEVETYVVKEKTPSVTFQGDVVVGTALPDTVVLHPVPKHDTYSYAVVNNKRVIVEGKTRKVVKVIE